jgi:hypothetical protein
VKLIRTAADGRLLGTNILLIRFKKTIFLSNRIKVILAHALVVATITRVDSGPGGVAQWSSRPSQEQKVPGSNLAGVKGLYIAVLLSKHMCV